MSVISADWPNVVWVLRLKSYNNISYISLKFLSLHERNEFVSFAVLYVFIS